MSASLGLFGPGFFGHALHENSRCTGDAPTLGEALARSVERRTLMATFRIRAGLKSVS